MVFIKIINQLHFVIKDITVVTKTFIIIIIAIYIPLEITETSVNASE